MFYCRPRDKGSETTVHSGISFGSGQAQALKL